MAYITITQNNFNEITNTDKTVLLDFWATWCGPCRMIAPIVEEIANERDDIIVGKINVDEENKLAKEFGIMSIPTLIVMRNGEVIQKSIGYMEKDRILALLD